MSRASVTRFFDYVRNAVWLVALIGLLFPVLLFIADSSNPKRWATV